KTKNGCVAAAIRIAGINQTVVIVVNTVITNFATNANGHIVKRNFGFTARSKICGFEVDINIFARMRGKVLHNFLPSRIPVAGIAGRRRYRLNQRSIGGISDLYVRSEEHTSELQSRENLVCGLLLEKKYTC